MPLIDLRSPTPGSANATTFGATVLSDAETAKTCAASPILLERSYAKRFSRCVRRPWRIVSGDLGAYQREYLPLAQASIKAAGGHLIAAGQNITVFGGPSPGTRVAINAFDSVDAAQAWRNSDAFKAARKVGEKYAKFRAFAVEGLPQ